MSGAIRIAVLEGHYDSVEANGSARLDGAHADKTLLAQGVGPDQPIEQKSLERSLILHRTEGWCAGQRSAAAGRQHGHIEPAGRCSRRPAAQWLTGHRHLRQPVHGRAACNRCSASQQPTGHWRCRRTVDGLVHGRARRVRFLSGTGGSPRIDAGCQLRGLPLRTVLRVPAAGTRRRRQGRGHAGALPVAADARTALLNVGLSLQHKSLVDNWAEGDLADRHATVATVDLDGIAAGATGQVRYQLALTRGDLKINGPAGLHRHQ